MRLNVAQSHFQTDPANRGALFAGSVMSVSVEVSSYCNRRCSFCPNSFVDRLTHHEYMDDAVWNRILADLAAAQWKGQFHFHRYNEPLEDRPYILKRIAEAKAALPDAELRIYTNGDYLTREYLDALDAAGVHWLRVMIYHPEHAPYDDVRMQKLFSQFLLKLGLPYRWGMRRPGLHEALVERPGMTLVVRAKDWGEPTFHNIDEIATSSRAGAVKYNEVKARTSPCHSAFTHVDVEVDGTVMPCCEVRSDVKGQDAIALGKVTAETGLLDIWTSKRAINLRNHLFGFGPKMEPCASCGSYCVPDSEAPRYADYRRQLGLPV